MLVGPRSTEDPQGAPSARSRRTHCAPVDPSCLQTLGFLIPLHSARHPGSPNPGSRLQNSAAGAVVTGAASKVKGTFPPSHPGEASGTADTVQPLQPTVPGACPVSVIGQAGCARISQCLTFISIFRLLHKMVIIIITSS